jgi:hypothetical protein
VDADDRLDVRSVASAHGHGDRNAAAAAGVNHEAIALAQSLDGELEPAQAVTFIRIGACQVKRDVRSMAIEHRRNVGGERLEIFVIAGTIPERDIEIAYFFVEWKVVRAVE